MEDIEGRVNIKARNGIDAKFNKSVPLSPRNGKVLSSWTSRGAWYSTTLTVGKGEKVKKHYNCKVVLGIPGRFDDFSYPFTLPCAAGSVVRVVPIGTGTSSRMDTIVGGKFPRTTQHPLWHTHKSHNLFFYFYNLLINLLQVSILLRRIYIYI